MGDKVISLLYVRHNSNNNMMGTQLNDMIIETIIENILLTIPEMCFTYPQTQIKFWVLKVGLQFRLSKIYDIILILMV